MLSSLGRDAITNLPSWSFSSGPAFFSQLAATLKEHLLVDADRVGCCCCFWRHWQFFVASFGHFRRPITTQLYAWRHDFGLLSSTLTKETGLWQTSRFSSILYFIAVVYFMISSCVSLNTVTCVQKWQLTCFLPVFLFCATYFLFSLSLL